MATGRGEGVHSSWEQLGRSSAIDEPIILSPTLTLAAASVRETLSPCPRAHGEHTDNLYQGRSVPCRPVLTSREKGGTLSRPAFSPSPCL